MSNMTVFDAFPNAIIECEIAEVNYSTITGNQTADKWQTIHVIIDEGSASDANQSPNSAGLASDTLLYAKPSELPTTDTSQLVANYAIRNKAGQTFEIVDAGIGMNQEIGKIEHVELKVKQTEIETSES